MPSEHKIETYKNFGKVLSISNGSIELKVTLDVGPRVIYCARTGGENVMYNDDALTSSVSGERFEDAFGKGKKWYIYGGHRIWISPEDFPLSYYPDNDPVEWRKDGEKYIFTPPQQKNTEYQFVLEIEPDKKKAAVTVNNIIINNSGGIRNIAPWALSVLAPDGLEIIPQPSEHFEFLSNREIVLWPYSNMADSRVYWGRDYITLKSVAGTPDGPFKLGINNTAGVAAYLYGSTAFVKHYTHNPKGSYPDRGVSYESYTDARFIEIESLGELSELLPGERCENTEVWKLFKIGKAPSPKNETAIKKLADKIFK